MSAISRNDFGALLRHMRGHRGVSQLALGLAAEVSSRHMSFLETGRARPSREMVLRLGEALGLSMRDCNEMLLAAGFAPVYGQTGLEHPDMMPVRHALERILSSHEPYPAIVLDRLWNIVRGNRTHHRLLAALVGDRLDAGGPVNALRLVFDPRSLRPCIRNWDEVARVLWHRLRQQAFMAPPRDAVHDLLAEVSRYPGVTDIADGRAPHAGNAMLLPLQLAMGNRMWSWFSTIATIGTPQDVTLQELRIETMFPMDEATERLAKEFAGRAGENANMARHGEAARRAGHRR